MGIKDRKIGSAYGMRETDIAVIGGGASGLMAALSAAKVLRKHGDGKRVLLLEGNDRVGKKLLATGNGRCNLSNEKLTEEAYYGNKDSIASILSSCGTEKVKALFADMGLLCSSDDQGRMYPYNLQAAAVLSVLRRTCEENGVGCICESEIVSVSRINQRFQLKTSNGEIIQTKKLILACGGKASSKHSCSQNGYELAGELGHSTTALQPALVQISCMEKITKTLKGLRSKAVVSLCVDGKTVATERGEVIFSDGALSGICIFDLSMHLAERLRQNKIGQPLQEHVEIVLDLLPQATEEMLECQLCKIQANLPKLPAKDILSGIVNIRVGEEIIKQQIKDVNCPIHLLNKELLRKITGAVKRFVFHPTGLARWDRAQVTLGGIPLEECDRETMESRHCRGLYIAGEMLDVTGRCGGYNLHFAWASGMIAGESAAENILLD